MRQYDGVVMHLPASRPGGAPLASLGLLDSLVGEDDLTHLAHQLSSVMGVKGQVGT
jgi:hypothetical protein